MFSADKKYIYDEMNWLKKINTFSLPDYYRYLFIFLVNIIFRVYNITSNQINTDEPFSIYFSQFSLRDIWVILTKGNNPPLYELLLHFWIKLFGISAFSVRLPSAIFMSLSAVILYNLSKNNFNRPIAILAVSFFTFSNLLIEYGQEARAYSLSVLFCIISFYFFLKLINANRNLLYYAILLGVTNALMLYTHYICILAIIIQFISIVFISFKQRNVVLYFLLSILVFAILFAPLAMVFYNRASGIMSNATWVEPSRMVDSYNMFVIYNNKPFLAVINLIVIFFFFGLLLLKKIQLNKKYWVVILWSIFPFITIFFFSLEISPIKIPMFIPRYTLFILPAYYMLISFAYYYVLRTFKAYYLFPLPFIILLFTFSARYDNYRQPENAINYIKQNQTATSLIIICPDWFNHNFLYYYNIDLFKAKKADDLANENILLLADSKKLENMDLSKYNQIIYLDAAADFAYPDNAINYLLQSKYTFVSAEHFSDIFTVSIYKK